MKGPGRQHRAPPGAVEKRVQRRRGAQIETAADLVAAEVPIALSYNGEPFAVMMATPDALEDFALGFTVSEGIAPADDTEILAIEPSLEGVSIRLSIPETAAAALGERRRNLQGRSGCGTCGTASIEAVLRPPPPVGSGPAVDMAALERALGELASRQSLNAATGATHAAAWADAHGGLVCVREDVGRHNALDKLIGALLSEHIGFDSGFVVITSRASYEMAMKAAQAGIALLAAISAPTALAIALAESAGLTLIGFARDGGCVVYAHPQRLTAPSAEAAA